MLNLYICNNYNFLFLNFFLNNIKKFKILKSLNKKLKKIMIKYYTKKVNKVKNQIKLILPIKLNG